jgi:hypothetical protein
VSTSVVACYTLFSLSSPKYRLTISIK